MYNAVSCRYWKYMPLSENVKLMQSAVSCVCTRILLHLCTI